MQKFDIVLATASPRRRALINKIPRVNPIFMAVDVAEIVLPRASETATRNARIKGEAAAKLTDKPVLAFDTVVGIDDRVLGKPATREQAVEMFRLLCGRSHEVVTAVYLDIRVNGEKNRKIIEKFEKTTVTFGAFDSELVYNYIDGGNPYDKAGGYNIDDPQLKPLIAGVDGDYDNVVGLPVKLTEKLLEENLFYGEAGNRA